ncbi:hypothetical protein SDJN03_03592, partial [Cucurbita argyrosperma subsp. sororia]
MAVAVFVPFNSYVSGVLFCVGSAVLAGEYYRCFTILKGNYPYEDKDNSRFCLIAVVCLRIQVKKTRNSSHCVSFGQWLIELSGHLVSHPERAFADFVLSILVIRLAEESLMLGAEGY